MRTVPIWLALTTLVGLIAIPAAILPAETPQAAPYDPCISAGIKKSVVFIGTAQVPDGTNKLTSPVYFGTGFVTEIDGVYYLFTAKHVIENSGIKPDEVVAFLNGLDGKLRAEAVGQYRATKGPQWIESNSADIAVIPFGVRPEYDVKAIPEALFLESSELLELQDLFFVSFQPGIDSSKQISPVTRRAMMSAKNTDGTFFMDAFAFPGNSGSPVFVKPSAASFVKGGAAIGGDPHSCHFVGMVGEYLTYQEVAVSSQTKRPRVVFEENTGLAKVWPVESIRQLLASPEFQAQHRAIKTPPAK